MITEDQKESGINMGIKKLKIESEIEVEIDTRGESSAGIEIKIGTRVVS
jgi:hypothetical protein